MVEKEFKGESDKEDSKLQIVKKNVLTHLANEFWIKFWHLLAQLNHFSTCAIIWILKVGISHQGYAHQTSQAFLKRRCRFDIKWIYDAKKV